MFNYIVVIILLIFSALFSGLTLGLMSLSAHELKRKASLGNKEAKKVYAIRKKGNLLLTTLLIGNVAVNALLSVFLGTITPSLTAVIIATSLIVILGEITPQAIFSRFALKLGAKTAWLVKIFIFVLFPLSWPIAWILNKSLGDELATIYSKKELMKIVAEHEVASASDINEDEERIIRGALSFSDKKVTDVMTPKSVVQAFEANTVIDKKFLNTVRKIGHSRLPVYREKFDNIIGMLYLNQLIGEKNLSKTAYQASEKKVIFVDENEKLDVVFNLFLNTRHHLFIVTNEFSSMVGIIALEDILEEIIKSEIVDERDKHKNLRAFARKQARKKRKKR